MIFQATYFSRSRSRLQPSAVPDDSDVDPADPARPGRRRHADLLQNGRQLSRWSAGLRHRLRRVLRRVMCLRRQEHGHR